MTVTVVSKLSRVDSGCVTNDEPLLFGKDFSPDGRDYFSDSKNSNLQSLFCCKLSLILSYAISMAGCAGLLSRLRRRLRIGSAPVPGTLS